MPYFFQQYPSYRLQVDPRRLILCKFKRSILTVPIVKLRETFDLHNEEDGKLKKPLHETITEREICSHGIEGSMEIKEEFYGL